MEYSGAHAVGVTQVRPVDDGARAVYERWIADGCHGDMDYLARYGDVRDNPALLLDGARTLIVAAFSYANVAAVAEIRRRGIPRIAEYALGRNYHNVLRRRLKKAAAAVERLYGGSTRVCIDTAPLRERYWAAQAGLGFIGVNNQLIIPGEGSHFFLGSILWTGVPDEGYDEPCGRSCLRCGACLRACPTGAISDDGRIDARRCLSYLTIESHAPLPDGIETGNRLFGCDTCRRVCPHQSARPAPTPLAEFAPLALTTTLTTADWLAMTSEEFDRLSAGTSLRRTTLEGIKNRLHGRQRGKSEENVDI